MDKTESRKELDPELPTADSVGHTAEDAAENAAVEPEAVRCEEQEDTREVPQKTTKKKVRRGKGGRGGRARRRRRARLEREEAETAHRLFVMNVQPHISPANLRAHFSSFGDVADVYMPINVNTHRRKGVAFVSYTSSEGVYNALRSGMHHFVLNCPLEVRLAEPRLRARPQRSDFRVYIQNVPIGTTRRELEDLFGAVAPVVDVHIPHKGAYMATFAFVSFESQESVNEILRHANAQSQSEVYDGHDTVLDENTVDSQHQDDKAWPILHGARLRISTAIRRPPAHVHNMMQQQHMAESTADVYYLHADVHTSFPHAHYHTAEMLAYADAQHYNNAYDFEYGDSAGKDEDGKDVDEHKTEENSDGECKIDAHDDKDKTTTESTEDEKQMNNSRLQASPRAQVLRRLALSGTCLPQRQQPSKMRSPMPRPEIPVPMPALGVAALRVHVGGLPQALKPEHIRTHFSEYGRVLDVHVPMRAGSNNVSRGFCFVTFADADSVIQACSCSPLKIAGCSVRSITPAHPRPTNAYIVHRPSPSTGVYVSGDTTHYWHPAYNATYGYAPHYQQALAPMWSQMDSSTGAKPQDKAEQTNPAGDKRPSSLAVARHRVAQRAAIARHEPLSPLSPAAPAWPVSKDEPGDTAEGGDSGTDGKK